MSINDQHYYEDLISHWECFLKTLVASNEIALTKNGDRFLIKS